MKLVQKYSLLYSTLIVLCGVLLLSSGCDDIVGCTDRTADNYNPDAVRDDNSCINARDKFLGVYRTLHIFFPDSLPVINSTNPDSTRIRLMTIAEDQLREGEDDVLIYNFSPDSLKVRALISRDKLNIVRQDFSLGGIPHTLIGEGYIDDNGKLTIRYTLRLMTTQQIIREDCVIFAERIN